MSECVRVEGITIPLDQVSHQLRRAYEMAQHEAATKTGPQRNVAKAAVARIAKEILNDALPHLALKHSPRSFGARGFFEAINKRALS
jgi:hypothetical protein